MSSEIVPADVDGIRESPYTDTGIDSNALRCKPRGFCNTEDIRPLDLLQLDWRGNRGIKVNLIGGNHEIRHLLSPDKGHKYLTQFNPTPYYVTHLLEEIKEPSMLLLRGCELLLRAEFPFEKFKTLTALEISGISHLTNLPEKAISEMTQLQTLNLSHLPISQLPANDFFSKLPNLRSLVLRGCWNLHSVPKFPQLTALQCLHLSDLLIETLPEGFFSDLQELIWLILRGCSELRYLPSTAALEKLEVLDLSHCTALKQLESNWVPPPSLGMLDLSYTTLPNIPALVTNPYSFTHLFLRDTKVSEPPYLKHPNSLKVLDLSGAENVTRIDQLQDMENLEALDLSRTGIETIEFIVDLNYLRYLILRGCTRLVELPTVENLTDLEVLDISGCELLGDLPIFLSDLDKLKELNLSGCSGLKELREGLFDEMSCLEKLDLSKTNINHLPSFANLTSLQTLNISQTPVEEVPDSSSLVSLKEFFFADCQKLKGVPAGLQTLTKLEILDLTPPRSGEIDFIASQLSRVGNLQEVVGDRNGNIHPRCLQGSISKPNELHLVSTFLSYPPSGFQRFKIGFGVLIELISNLQKIFKPTIIAPTPTTTAVSCDIKTETFSRHFRNMDTDLKYILEKISFLESSRNCRRGEGLLHELMHAADRLQAEDFTLDSRNLNELIRMVAKLKVLVPPKLEEGLEGEKTNEKKKKPLFWFKRREKAVSDNDSDIDMSTLEMQNLLRSYESLTDTQRKCLLYFAVFLCYGYFLVEERILIHLWYGEGFIDPEHVENLDQTTCSNPNPQLGTSAESEAVIRNDANRVSLQVSTTKGVENQHTVEELGQQIMLVLKEMGFIRKFRDENREPRVCCMDSTVHSFVTAQAKAEHFFDFDHRNGQLTPHLTGSQRACLLKSRDDLLSSCKLWVNYTNSSDKLERFKTVRTLFNVNETIIDIKKEWLSKMRNLSVLHLGNWEFENEETIDFVDLKFLEELKNMTQLRLLGLEGILAIRKLPDSVCKLTNLKILNLRDCTYLEELPAGIGSLKNLTHLDLTHCRLLSMLPKGIRLLPKLEVLKGFVITYESGGGQNRKACILKELLNLKSLRKLNLTVNRDQFPDCKDLQVFKEMKSLCNLKITWQKNYNADQEPQEEELRQYSRWQKLKCWEKQAHQNDKEEALTSNHLDNLKKLVLCCFPSETAPDWLGPTELQNLEKLYIVGGNLKAFRAGTNQNIWNVKILRLKYLPNLDMDWEVLRHIFPNTPSLQKFI